MEGRPLEDAELVERAQRGDVECFEELVRRYQAIAFRTACLVAGNAADAEDAAQSAFVKAYYALSGFRTESPFRPWLLQIVANEAKNRRRSAGRLQGLRVRLVENRPRDDAAPSPEGAVLARADRERLLEEVAGLRERDRLVITYRYLLELSEEETAQIMGCSRGTVKSRLHRALNRLQARLAEPDVAIGGEKG